MSSLCCLFPTARTLRGMGWQTRRCVMKWTHLCLKVMTPRPVRSPGAFTISLNTQSVRRNVGQKFTTNSAQTNTLHGKQQISDWPPCFLYLKRSVQRGSQYVYILIGVCCVTDYHRFKILKWKENILERKYINVSIFKASQQRKWRMTTNIYVDVVKTNT